MEDFDKTIAPHREYVSSGADDVTIPGRRDRKNDGRFQVGDLIMDRYKVLAELGQGGMGVVYKCFDETAGIEVALKALPPELSHNTLEMEDIKENFQLVAKLVHQNIAISKNLERDMAYGNYYLIMECCEGEDLRRWIRRKRKEGKLTPEDVLPVIRQVASALDYAHEQKIIHRDIKPGNIMIDHFGKIKVLDFGLAAQIHTSMTRVSMAYHGTSGTGPYMAPEQWRGRAQGAAADQYALAVMTYEMLAGHLPFESADPAVLQQAVLTQEPEEITGVPKNICRAIKRAMSKEPSERFATCQEFAAALDGKKINAVKNVRKVGFGKLVAAVVVLALLGAVGTGYYFFDEHQKKQARLAKLAAEKAEQDRQAKLAAEMAEKARLAKLAAEKAEKERQAKIAAEKAEKERQAKIAAKKAEEERQANLSAGKAKKRRLDSENFAVKVESRNKIAKIKQKNHESDQSFEKNSSDMNTAFALPPIKKNPSYIGQWVCNLEVHEEKHANIPTSLHLFAELAPVSTEIHLNLNDDKTVEIHEKSGRMFGCSKGKYEFMEEGGIISMELTNTVTGQKYAISGFIHWLDKDKQKFELDFEDFEYAAILFAQLKAKEGIKVHSVNSSVQNSSKSLSIGITLSEKNQNIQFTTLNISKYIFKKQ